MLYIIAAHVWDSYEIDAILCVGSKTCVISEGKVYCIGENVVRRKYVGYTTWGVEKLPNPFLIREIDNIIEIDGGDDIVCGLQRGGALFCWGILPYKATNGQMYESNTDPPKMILDGTVLATKVAHFAVADDAVCYYLENKNTQCFGKNQYGDELGGLSDPTYIGEVSKLVAGAHHFCASLQNGNLLCWGTMGDNLKITTPTLIMTEVADISTSSSKIYGAGNVVSITSTSFARKNNGTLYGWGDNIWNQFGTCETKFRETPAQVNLEIPSVEVKSYHLTERTSHAILLDGTIAAWGMNWYSTLGNGKSSRYTTVVSPPTFMNLFYQDTPQPTSIPFSCPATERPSFRPSFAPSQSPTRTMSPMISPTMRPTIGSTSESKIFSITTTVIASLVVVVTLVGGFVIYYKRRNRGLQNDPIGNDVNPGRAEPDEIPIAFNISPITSAIAVPVTDTVHVTAKIIESNGAMTSNTIPSEQTLSYHPIPSAPPMESVENTRTP